MESVNNAGQETLAKFLIFFGGMCLRKYAGRVPANLVIQSFDAVW